MSGHCLQCIRMNNMAAKQWGSKPFWGIGFEYDPQWKLNSKQQDLQIKLIQVCKSTIRPNAVKHDELYTFPKDSMTGLSSLNLLGLLVPKELGGLGESHQCASMVVETIARYGCPSTAMVYVMHLASCATLLLRHHNSKEIQNLMRRLDKDVLVGSLAYSDPATGGHFWYALSSKAAKSDDGGYQVLKYASWVTSAGSSDFYAVQTTSPNFSNDYSDMSVFLIYKDEVRTFLDEWKALGMHGNMSAPVIFEAKLGPERLVGPIGDGADSNDETVDPFFLLLSSACWNGIAMACIDLAKKHATEKQHADVGLRVVDYPTIQDTIADCLMNANCCRLMVSGVAQGMDQATNNNDWSMHADIKLKPRFGYLHWCWQVRYQSAKMVDKVSNKMLHVCGGDGYKTELGLERLLRDAKAAWIMGPSNEVLRGFVGTTSLSNMDATDYWCQHANKRLLNSEVKKMTTEQKRQLAEKLLKDVSLDESDYNGENEYQGSEFDNPFNVTKPAVVSATAGHKVALNFDGFTPVTLVEQKELIKDVVELKFALPDPAGLTGCYPGQYVQVEVSTGGKKVTRYVSPVSSTTAYGSIILALKLETVGQFSTVLRKLKVGEKIGMRGPCGGLEYKPSTLSNITFITSGVGITPAIQMIRTVLGNPNDKTNIGLLNYARTEEEILYKTELEAYQAKDSRIKLCFTVGEPSADWKGGEGYIDKAMLKAVLPDASVQNQKIVLCGGPQMVILSLDQLKELGYRSDCVFIYGAFGVEQLRAIFGRRSKLSGQAV